MSSVSQTGRGTEDTDSEGLRAPLLRSPLFVVLGASLEREEDQKRALRCQPGRVKPGRVSSRGPARGPPRAAVLVCRPPPLDRILRWRGTRGFRRSYRYGLRPDRWLSAFRAGPKSRPFDLAGKGASVRASLKSRQRAGGQPVPPVHRLLAMAFMLWYLWRSGATVR